MDFDQVELTLLPAPGDPERVCYEIQAKLAGVGEYLRRNGVGVITIGAHPTGDSYIGQLVFTLGPNTVTAVEAVAGAWIQTRFGRRVRLKFDDVEVEAQTTRGIEELLRRAFALGRQQASC